MRKLDKRIDAYIAKAGDYAKPILKHLRKLVRQAAPGAVETIKWGVPHYTQDGILLATAAFKAHCLVVFWKGKLIKDKNGQNIQKRFRRVMSLADLEADKVMLGYIREAVRLNVEGVAEPVKARSKVKRKLVVPDYFMAALRKNRKALAAFEAFSHSHKKEYVEWVTEAKGEDTRARRLATTVKWLAQGKSRNWKYEKC